MICDEEVRRDDWRHSIDYYDRSCGGTYACWPADLRSRAQREFHHWLKKALNCEYKSVRGWRENYIGQISRGGLDIGFTTSGKLAWAVYAPAKRGPGALTGDYGGASVEATVGGGGGANVLVGGFRRSISLQPISVATQHGLDFAVTISEMELQLVR